MIKTPNNPDRLVVAWEAPKSAVDRCRWAIGELMLISGEAQFRYYLGEEFVSQNHGRAYQQMADLGYEGFPGFYPPKQQLPFRSDVIDAFRRRLPPEKRSDFSQYLAHYGLETTQVLPDMALLGVTGARLPSDGFELVDPLTSHGDQFEVVLQVAGYRHYLENAAALKIGDPLALESEPENQFDPDAIAVRFSGKAIGHVNRLQAKGLKLLMDHKEVEAVAMRLNGTQFHPRAYALVKVRPKRQKVAA